VLTFLFARKKNHSAALIAILSLSLFLKLYCSRDPYLHQWDERYHALVAKNMITQPLKPTLYQNPVLPYDYKDWTANHIWLSKPPVPLWFMAGSIAVFGTHEYAVRVPGILFSIASVLLTFLIARKFFDVRIALLAAFLHGISGIGTDLASGRLSSDGVETCFLFFVELAMWWIVRTAPGNFKLKHYAVAGILTGIAVMCKWQPALLCLAIMFVYHWQRDVVVKHIFYSFLAFLSAAVVFVPWLVHCFVNFPVETKWLLQSLFSPMTDNGAGHQGTWYSHILNFSNFFGWGSLLLMIVAIVLFIKSKSRVWLLLLLWALLPLIIFSFAEMKRGTYLMIGAPAAFMVVSYFALQMAESFRFARFPIALAWISVVTIVGYSIEKLYLFSDNKPGTSDWSETIKNADYSLGTIIYNEVHCIEVMFYHDDVVAYAIAGKDLSE